MKNSKHTKGKWKIVLDSETTSNSIGIIIKSENGNDLFFTPNEDEESKANAKIVIYAPELLEALIGMVNAFEELAEQAQYKSGVFMAKQAIKKATE